MKKLILLLSLISMSFASCSKNNDETDNDGFRFTINRDGTYIYGALTTANYIYEGRYGTYKLSGENQLDLYDSNGDLYTTYFITYLTKNRMVLQTREGLNIFREST